GRVDPEARAGPAGVAKRGARGKPAPAGPGVARVDIPAEGAAIVALELDAGHLGYRLRFQDTDAVEFAVVEQHADETREVGGGAEQSGMAGDAAHPARRRVVDDAVDHPARHEFGRGDAREFP